MLLTRPRDGHDAHNARRLEPCHVATGTGPVPMIAETTGIAGLLLGPAVTAGPHPFTGLWTLIHQPSGSSMTPPLPLAYVREAVLWLAGRDLEWDRPLERLRRDPKTEDARTDLLGALMAAQGLFLAEPLFYARASWLQTPPQWRIWHRDQPADAAFATFEAAAAEAEIAGPDPELVVRRDSSSPGWTLRCAAPLCGTGFPARLTVDDDTPLTGARDALIADALVLDWASADRQHWICPDCVRAHQR